MTTRLTHGAALFDVRKQRLDVSQRREEPPRQTRSNKEVKIIILDCVFEFFFHLS